MTVSEETPTRAARAARPRDLDPAAIAAVDDVLGRRLATQGAVLRDVSPDLAPVVSVLDEALQGGKRLRAAFCLWAARAAAPGAPGDEPAPGVLDAAAALELFHLAALVHDDLMDHSDVRRGRPTVHRRFAAQHRADGGLGDADDHGVAVAVLAGDLCLTWSDDLVADAVRAAPGTGAATRALWSQMRSQVLAGQYLDLLGQTRALSSPAAVRRVLHYKSAKYTVEHPLLLGGTLAGAGEGLLESFRSFGLAVGEAFQLRDDVLGVFGEPTTTGKPTLDDVREGKRTLLVAWAEEAATRDQRAVLARRLGSPDLDEDGLEEVRDVLQGTGSLARVEERIAELAALAHHELSVMDADDDAVGALGALTDACAWRAA